MDLIGYLKDHFKLETFRKGQKEILTSILAGKDTLAIMPTGGGKSLCYQLPAVAQGGLVIVVSPLISLMEDQVRSLQSIGIPAGCLHSNQNVATKRKIFAQLQRKGAFLLYLSPERVQKEGFSEWLKAREPVLFAIDEAHCISQWGHDFREDYAKLFRLREIHPHVPILALTATATPHVGNDIARQLQLKKPDRHVYGFYRPNLFYQVNFCEDESQKKNLLIQGVENNPQGRIIVYCGTRKSAEAISDLLGNQFSGVDYYHAGLNPVARENVQAGYDKGNTRILCATNAFGMGIDHPDVRLIMHYEMPANLESYYQEVGRAGRDGKESTCLLLYSKKDKGLQSYFISSSKAPQHIANNRWKALDAIVNYSEGGECRHNGILTYFKDAQRISHCGHCDTCDPDSARRVQITASQSQEFVPSFVVRKSKSAKKKSFTNVPMTDEIEFRMKQIRTWRLKYAQEKDIPAFLVFSNKTLTDLAAKNPRTTEDLLRVYGMGEMKAESFGKELLEVISHSNEMC